MVRYLILTFMLIVVCGCRRLPERPEGLPELYPCKITVTFGGEPVENVNVSLLPNGTDSKWKSGGKTDEKGCVEVRTAFAYPGAPQGTFTVAFTKTEEQVGMTLAEMMPLSLIPLKYGPDRSKEVIDVKPGKNEFQFTLDAGEEKLPIPKGAYIPSARMKKP